MFIVEDFCAQLLHVFFVLHDVLGGVGSHRFHLMASNSFDKCDLYLGIDFLLDVVLEVCVWLSTFSVASAISVASYLMRVVVAFSNSVFANKLKFFLVRRHGFFLLVDVVVLLDFDLSSSSLSFFFVSAAFVVVFFGRLVCSLDLVSFLLRR